MDLRIGGCKLGISREGNQSCWWVTILVRAEIKRCVKRMKLGEAWKVFSVNVWQLGLGDSARFYKANAYVLQRK